ncbi:MAG: ATP-dependent helicase [Candidatus Omnitrophota bacterium]
MTDIEQIIHGDATPDQIKAIDHIGSHGRLLAGPGTGKTKTLTHRVLSLVLKHGQASESILLLTFTRLAAGQLRSEIQKVLAPHNKEAPHIATLHSFALQQILFNWRTVDALPRPIRIADDWEERYIIDEDLKRYLNLSKIDEVKTLINQLSTDWETLRIDEAGWEQQFPNPQFLGAWRQHKEIYGETLRAELVYQLKRQLNQNRDFKLTGDYKHVLIDEYQDLNSCDLAIIKELSSRGAEVFVAGDDDQSIYGFRYADPAGIKLFPQIYSGASKLALEICFRCDKSIFSAAEFVAGLDHTRLPKPTRPRTDAESGEVLLLNFSDQDQEASFVARKIKELVTGGIAPDKIAILLRNERHGTMSKPLIEAIKKESVNVSLPEETTIDSLPEYRTVLSVFRLMASNKEDSLAWRTILTTLKVGIGQESFSAIESLAHKQNIRFGQAVMQIVNNPSSVQRFGQKIKTESEKIITNIEQCTQSQDIKVNVALTVDCFVAEEASRVMIKTYLNTVIDEQAITDMNDLLRELSVSSGMIEQETVAGAVNILTMHQAKGLTFDVCFIVGAEDELIPGKNQGEKEGDERRLLYVSMTRAKHKLYITYCSKRTGHQMYAGRNSGNPNRTLTKFLRDSKIKVVRG